MCREPVPLLNIGMSSEVDIAVSTHSQVGASGCRHKKTGPVVRSTLGESAEQTTGPVALRSADLRVHAVKQFL